MRLCDAVKKAGTYSEEVILTQKTIYTKVSHPVKGWLIFGVSITANGKRQSANVKGWVTLQEWLTLGKR